MNWIKISEDEYRLYLDDLFIARIQRTDKGRFYGTVFPPEKPTEVATRATKAEAMAWAEGVLK